MFTLPRADYYAFERTSHTPERLSQAGPWDVLLSAYDETARVQTPFEEVRAAQKVWIVHEEFGLSEVDRPRDAVPLSASFDPPAVLNFVRDIANDLRGARVCVDITGFIRPHLLILMWALRDVGVRSFHAIYSDPMRYIANEYTQFTTGPIIDVVQVPGYEGLHRVPSGTEDDILVIGSGYDYEQIARACEAKRTSKKYVVTGLPSLQPHMYQENILRIDQARESIGSLPRQRLLYASANHPFAVAQELHKLMAREREEAATRQQEPGNFYLCPTGPKPHVLGFALYYLRELEGSAASIIYPLATSYSKLTTDGLLRTWQYEIEL